MEIFRTVPNRREVLVTGLLLLCDDLCLLFEEGSSWKASL